MLCTFSDLKMQAWKGEGMMFCRGRKIGIIETRAEGMTGLWKEWSQMKVWASHFKSVDAMNSSDCAEK